MHETEIAMVEPKIRIFFSKVFLLLSDPARVSNTAYGVTQKMNRLRKSLSCLFNSFSGTK